MQQKSNLVDLVPRNYVNYVYDVNIQTTREGQEKPLDLSFFCRDVMIVSKFDDNQFPYILVSFLFDRDNYTEVQQYYREMKFILTITQKRVTGLDKSDTPIPYIRNAVFTAMDLEEEAPPNEELDKQTNPLNTYAVTLTLFLTNHLKINKTILNKVYHDVTMEQLLTLLASVYCNLNFSTYLSKPDKHEKTPTYQNVIIPPYSPTNAFKYLQDYYGIFKQGLKTFCDFDTFYLMAMDKIGSKENKNTGEKEHSLVSIEVIEEIQRDVIITAYTATDDEQATYHLRTFINNATIKPSDSYSREIDGSEIIVVNTSNEKGVNKLKGSSGVVENATGNKQKSIYNNSSNTFAISDQMRKNNEGIEQMTLTFNHSSLNIFSLEKKVRLAFTGNLNRGFKGDFRFKSAIHHLSKATGEVTWLSTTKVHIVKI